jgi:hypothetical protein
MTRLTGIVALLLVLAPAGLAAQRPGSEVGRRPGAWAPARRERLQQQIVARFMDRAAARLGLDTAGRARLERVIGANDLRRQELAREARLARTALVRAARDPSTPDAEYDRLLRRMANLRERDLRLWENEQTALAGVLTPRQRVQFMAMRLEFFDMVQRMRGAAPPPADSPGQP